MSRKKVIPIESEKEPAEQKPATPEQKPPASQAKRPVIVVNDPLKAEEKGGVKSRDLFEPVIISIPRSNPAKPAGGSQKPAAEADGNKKPDESVNSGATRRRVVEGKEITSDQQCSIDVNQENISILSGGGSLGVLVTIEGDGQPRQVSATSNSPRDVEVRAEPQIDGISGRRFYVIKSISSNTGVYQVNFESPCGKKEIMVRVR